MWWPQIPKYERRKSMGEDKYYKSYSSIVKRAFTKFDLYKRRMLYFVEDVFGFNARYWYHVDIGSYLNITIEVESLRMFRNEEIKSYILNGTWAIDEIISPFSFHTLLHESITAHNDEIFEFLVSQKANCMVRDNNGYTPLLKAASVGDLNMVKTLIEVGGVDPRHIDPFGNTPLDKAKLYDQTEVINYLEEVTKKIIKQETDPDYPEDQKIFQEDWETRPLYHRGRYRTLIDYKAI